MELIDKQLKGKEFLTINDVAELHNVSRDTVYDWIKNEAIPQPVRLLGRWVFPKASLEGFTPPWAKKGGLKPGAALGTKRKSKKG